jgi:hypothetical protein
VGVDGYSFEDVSVPVKESRYGLAVQGSLESKRFSRHSVA